jgi:hypothetical protein
MVAILMQVLVRLIPIGHGLCESRVSALSRRRPDCGVK